MTYLHLRTFVPLSFRALAKHGVCGQFYYRGCLGLAYGVYLVIA